MNFRSSAFGFRPSFGFRLSAFGFPAHDLRQPSYALAAAGDSAGAARLLLVVGAHAAAVADTVHSGAAAAEFNDRHLATRQKIRVGCLVLAVACLVLALARPQWGFDWEEVKQRGLDIVVAIDTSKSMLAEDIAPNRLARAKLAALDLMQRAKSDRLGLVAFAGTAFLQCPLTIDDAAFRQSVEALDVNTIPQGGTAIAEAIETALTAYKEGDNYKVLVLFTDGEDHDSGALEAAEKAAKEGLRIFTIGIGTAEGELLRIKDAQGGSDYVRDEQGNVVKSHLNERLLQQIAGATEGGFYLPLRGAKVIDTLYDAGPGETAEVPAPGKTGPAVSRAVSLAAGGGDCATFGGNALSERKREPRSKPAPAPAAETRLTTALQAEP